jgi:hypothetical protein
MALSDGQYNVTLRRPCHLEAQKDGAAESRSLGYDMHIAQAVSMCAALMTGRYPFRG